MATSIFTQNPLDDRNQDATIYVGNLDEKVTEPILWEFFLQAGPVSAVHMPKDRVSGNHQGYGFVEFLSEEDADYALKIMNMIKLYGKPIRVNKAAAQQKNLDVGANVFIGNLDPELDEKMLYDIFSAFGVILQTPKIMRDIESGTSKGFAFVNYASFEASDSSIAAMNGQHLLNRAITVSYAFKKDSKGERHGSSAERLLATTNPFTMTDKPHHLFADAPSVVLNPDAPGGAVPLLPQPTPMNMPQNPYYQQGVNPFAPNPMGHLNAPMMPNQHGLPMHNMVHPNFPGGQPMMGSMPPYGMPPIPNMRPGMPPPPHQ